MFFDCNSDISAHVTSCHLSKCGDATEGPLVLARAGISHLSATQGAGMTIYSRPEVLPIPWSYWESCKCAGRPVVNFPNGRRNTPFVWEKHRCRIT